MKALPKRYEAVTCLGRGGAGEVWAVEDRLARRRVAFKVIVEGSSQNEVHALVREATTLTGLEGLGLPKVLGFGRLPGGAPYLVRELAEGESLSRVLETRDPRSWLVPIARVAEQLTAIHRSGLLHGDVKPGNIIVGAEGHGTLVDLGLVVPFLDGGTAPRGLTPKYAAPELLEGQPATVRSEVYSLGATLEEGLNQRGDELSENVREGLVLIARRAMDQNPRARYPSVEEFGIALCNASGLPPFAVREEAAWPVVGLDALATEFVARLKALPSGNMLVLTGPSKSGRSTLSRRVAWTLAIDGHPVALLDAIPSGMSPAEALEIELASVMNRPEGTFVVLDDADGWDAKSFEGLGDALRRGARVLAVASESSRVPSFGQNVVPFPMPPLDARVADDLVCQAMPSLQPEQRRHLVAKSDGRPGVLREFVRRLRGQVVVSSDDIDERLSALDTPRPQSMSGSQELTLHEVAQAVDRGRFGAAEEMLDQILAEAAAPEIRFRAGMLRARIALGKGLEAKALALLMEVQGNIVLVEDSRAWFVIRSRVALRMGAYQDAIQFASMVLKAGSGDGLAADALSVRGVALAYTGEDAQALVDLERAVPLGRESGNPRYEAIAWGSLAVAHQRAGRIEEARDAHQHALVAAEAAKDASSIAATRLNLAILAQAAGDFAIALQHLEATVDLGQRAGGLVPVRQATLNLANLDLYLGRLARAKASLDRLGLEREDLQSSHRAQLLGLEAEWLARTGNVEGAMQQYEACAEAWETLGRHGDAAEASLEGLLLAARLSKLHPEELQARLDSIEQRWSATLKGAHETLLEFVRGNVAFARNETDLALDAFGRAISLAQAAHHSDWTWRIYDARSRLFKVLGRDQEARSDLDAARILLEETSSKLPKDLREVFWNEPRRGAIRRAGSITWSGPTGNGGSASVPTTAIRPEGARSSVSVLAQDRMARLLELTRELARERDVSRLLARVTDHAVALLGAERGVVLLLNADGVLVARTARERLGEDAYVDFSKSVAEAVVNSGEPVVTVSARDDRRLASAVSVHQLMIQSVACVPIRGSHEDGKPIGALYVETRLGPMAQFHTELPMLMAFADQASIAIETARLLEDNRQRAQDLERANAELAATQRKLEQALGRRTEQLSVARRDLQKVRAEIKSHFGFGGIIGTSPAMRKVFSILERVRDADVPVLITGESGTGKEVVAKALHSQGNRSKAPFGAINCGAIPDNLLESELFGHVRGAFTGAEKDRPGVFRDANGGMVFLDEIGEMPIKMQAGILRVLQEKCVRPVGASFEKPVDTRIIAATNRNLAEMVKEGTFREDLFYRLHVVEVRLPPLRERVEDIPALVDHFLSIFALRYRRDRKVLAKDATKRLLGYSWPGNVRQLENVLLNAWLMSEGHEIEGEDLNLPDASARRQASVVADAVAVPRPSVLPGSATDYKEREKERILGALQASNWNRVRAAEMLGVPRRTFYRRLKEFGIQ